MEFPCTRTTAVPVDPRHICVEGFLQKNSTQHRTRTQHEQQISAGRHQQRQQQQQPDAFPFVPRPSQPSGRRAGHARGARGCKHASTHGAAAVAGFLTRPIGPGFGGVVACRVRRTEDGARIGERFGRIDSTHRLRSDRGHLGAARRRSHARRAREYADAPAVQRGAASGRGGRLGDANKGAHIPIPCGVLRVPLR
eukprot:358619-Chlamydomonas_euryale.AAC.11